MPDRQRIQGDVESTADQTERPEGAPDGAFAYPFHGAVANGKGAGTEPERVLEVVLEIRNETDIVLLRRAVVGEAPLQPSRLNGSQVPVDRRSDGRIGEDRDERGDYEHGHEPRDPGPS